MTVLASQIAAEAARDLGDDGFDRWTEDDHLAHLNDGQRDIATLKPDSNATRGTWKLVAGVVQSVPDGTVSFLSPAGATLPAAILLMDVIRNMGTDGETRSRAVDKVDRPLLNALDPFWSDADSNATVEMVIVDERDPKKFEVYPPQPSSSQGYIECLYAAVPVVISTIDSAITLPDEYKTALHLYDLYRCYARDAADSPLNYENEIKWWNRFATHIGRMDLIRKTEGANRHNPDPSPVQATNDRGQPWQM